MIVFPVPLRGRRTRTIGAAIAAVGGLLVLVEGLLLPAPEAAAYADLAVIVGLGIVAAAAAGERAGAWGPAFGGVVVVLAIVAFFTVDGYLLGALLASLGGTILVLLPGASFSRIRARGGSTFSEKDLGPPCVACGRHVPTWTTFCPYCGASQRAGPPPT